jgi:hypothetical protein
MREAIWDTDQELDFQCDECLHDRRVQRRFMALTCLECRKQEVDGSSGLFGFDVCFSCAGMVRPPSLQPVVPCDMYLEAPHVVKQMYDKIRRDKQTVGDPEIIKQEDAREPHCEVYQIQVPYTGDYGQAEILYIIPHNAEAPGGSMDNNEYYMADFDELLNMGSQGGDVSTFDMALRDSCWPNEAMRTSAEVAAPDE